MNTLVMRNAKNAPAPQRGLPDLESVLRTALTGQAVAATSLLGTLAARFGGASRGNANRITQLLGDLGCGFAGLELDITEITADGPFLDLNGLRVSAVTDDHARAGDLCVQPPESP